MVQFWPLLLKEKGNIFFLIYLLVTEIQVQNEKQNMY